MNHSGAISTRQRAQAHALGMYDAGVGAAESAGYSFGIVGTPESRAAWAIQASKDSVASIMRFVDDPIGSVGTWWNNLTGNDPGAIRQATAQGTGVVIGLTGGFVAKRLSTVRSTGGAAFVNGMFVHELKPVSNLELYGTAITRTPGEAVQILKNVGHDSQMLSQYKFVKLSDTEYAARVKQLGYEFDASYGFVGSNSPSVTFNRNIASPMSDGSSRINVYVRRQVFESDESIVQTLSHEIFEIEELRYLAAKPISVSENLISIFSITMQGKRGR